MSRRGQIDVGRGEVHPAEHSIAVAKHVGAQHRDRARGRRQQAEQDRQRRRLAGTVAAQQRCRRARRNGEAHAVQRGHRAEALDEIIDDDRVRRGDNVSRRMGSLPPRWKPNSLASGVPGASAGRTPGPSAMRHHRRDIGPCDAIDNARGAYCRAWDRPVTSVRCRRRRKPLHAHVRRRIFRSRVG